MKIILVWLLISGIGIYSPPSVLQRFPDKANCEHVKKHFKEISHGELRCVQAYVVEVSK